MIIQGKISTDNGPIEIEELKVGDRVLNILHKPLTVTQINKRTIYNAYTFKKNPMLKVSGEAVIKTALGDKLIKDIHGVIYASMPNMRMIKDSVIKSEGEFTAYEIKVEGSDSFFASNYAFSLEDRND